MRLQVRDFQALVNRVGTHTLELNLAGQRYRLTETEARSLANELLKTVDTQGE